MNKIIKIGMCGKSGSGKGFVSKCFERLGVPSVDTDAVYRAVLANGGDCFSEIVSEFGGKVLSDDGKLDRRALSQIVFAPDGAEKLKKLNSIAHKYILTETLCICDEYEKEGFLAVIIDAPVLFESGFNSICDFTFFVSCPIETCIERICERDGITDEMARRRLLSQKDDEELRALCDKEIVNDGNSDIETQARGILREVYHYEK